MRRPLAIVVLLVVVVSSLTLVNPSHELSAENQLTRAPAPRVTRLVLSDTPTNANWPTYLYDVERTGANLEEDVISPANVSALQPLWSIPSNGSDFSAPIVVNGTVYFGSWNGSEEAVNATTGAVEWTTFLGTDTTCGVFNPMGISSTPAYWNGTLYLGGGNGYWYALNASSGTIEWRYIAPWETNFYYNWASALVYNGTLYVGLSSCLDNPLIPAGLLALDVRGATPTLLAVFNDTPSYDPDGDSIWSSPSLDPQSNTVWVTTGNENGSLDPLYPRYSNAIIALNATTLNVSGSWQVPNVAGKDSDFGTTPTIITTFSGQQLVVAADKNGYTYAFNMTNVTANGSWGPIWSLYTAGGWGGAAYASGTLYIGGDRSVFAVDPDNGTVLWRSFLLNPPILGALTWADGVVYLGAGSAVYALNASTGAILWDNTPLTGGSVVSEPVVSGSVLYVTAGDYGPEGDLTAFGLPSNGTRVTFVEQGLVPDATWAVTINGTTDQADSTEITLDEPPGTYSYTIMPIEGYTVVIGPGTLSVAGLAIWVPVVFAPLTPALQVLLDLYGTRSDLQAAFPSILSNSSSFAGLVTWAAQVATGVNPTDSSESTLSPFGYYYDLMSVYNSRSDLQTTYPDAYSNLASYSRLVSWAGEVVTGVVTPPDSSQQALLPFGYYYALMYVYNARPDLQAAFPNALSNQTNYIQLVTWAGQVVSGAVQTDSSIEILLPFGYYYDLMAVYSGRFDLQHVFQNAFSNQTSYEGLVSWAGDVVTGQFPGDSSYATLWPFAAYYDLMSVYNGRQDLQHAYPGAYSNEVSYTELVSWAGRAVTGTIQGDSSSAELDPFGWYYDLMWVYNSRYDLQRVYPSAYSEETSYTQLLSWAGKVVTGVILADSSNVTLQPFGYYYDLMYVYSGRPDLQTAFPGAYSNEASYTKLLSWAGQVVTGVIPTDSSNMTLQPFGYYYDLMYVYNGRSDLQHEFPDAYTNGTNYERLLAWAAAVAEVRWPDSSYPVLIRYAEYYEAMG